MTKFSHEKVSERLGWDNQMDLNSLDFHDLRSKISEMEVLQAMEEFQSEKYQKFFRGWIAKARSALSSMALAKVLADEEKTKDATLKSNESVPTGETPKTDNLLKKGATIDLTSKAVALPRNTLTPASYSRGNDDSGDSDAEKSEDSDGSLSPDEGNRYRINRMDAQDDSGSDSEWTEAKSKKNRKRKGDRRRNDSDSGEEGEARTSGRHPKTTYDRKFIHSGELIDDSWVDATLSDAEHCSAYAAMTSSAKLQNARSKFMKTTRYLVQDGVIVVPESSSTMQGYDQNQNKQIQGIIGATIPTELVDSLIESMDGSVFGASQYEQFQQKVDKWLKENVKTSQPTTNKILKLTLEGYLQSLGQFSTFMKDIRWKSADELKNGISKVYDKGASDTKNTIGKWSNSAQASSSSSSSSATLKKQLSKDVNSTTPACLIGTPMAGNLHSCGNVPPSDMLFWRDWNQSLNDHEKLALLLIHEDSFAKHQTQFMSTNLLSSTVRCHIELYAGYQRLMHNLILQMTTKLSLKYTHMLPTVTALQKLGEDTPSLDDQCMHSKVVPPTLLSKYAHVTSHNVHLGAMAFDIFLKAHHQTGKMRTLDKFAKILTKSMNLDEGLLAHFQNTRREYLEFASTRPFENSGRDRTPPVTVQIDDSLFIWYYKGAAEDLLNKLSGSELVQFQLFYKEVVELTTIDEIGNLVEQYHGRSCFLPTGRADTFAAGSYGGGAPPVEHSISELKNFGDLVEQALLEADVEDPMFLYKGVKIPKNQVPNSIYKDLTMETKAMVKTLRIYGNEALRARGVQAAALKKSETANNNKKIKVSSPQPTPSASSSSSSTQPLLQAEMTKQMSQQIANAVRQQVANALKASLPTATTGSNPPEAITAAAAAAPANVPAAPMNPNSSNTKKGDGKGGGKGGKGAGSNGGKGNGKGGKGKGGKGGKGQNNNWNNWNNNQYWNNGWGDSYGWGSGN
jgi:hypothetical protein